MGIYADWPIATELKDSMKIILAFQGQLPQHYIDLFCKATHLLAPAIKDIPHVYLVHVFFVYDRLTVEVTDKQKIAEYFGRTILYPYVNLQRYVNDERRLVVIFLEELVHAYFDTGDEVFVGKKVAELYPEVGFNETTGEYIFPT